MGREGPKWGREDVFLLIQTLPTFWAERILILRVFIFWMFWAPSLGPAWARLGPSLAKPVHMHALKDVGRVSKNLEANAKTSNIAELTELQCEIHNFLATSAQEGTQRWVGYFLKLGRINLVPMLRSSDQCAGLSAIHLGGNICSLAKH